MKQKKAKQMTRIANIFAPEKFPSLWKVLPGLIKYFTIRANYKSFEKQVNI
tara:strand:+ start:589 stop:741 length:153 start_codon:yes stop_codon:yes gene_type:complete